MHCLYCQTINPSYAKFCLECGNRFSICPHCGTANLPVAKFCIECGTILHTKSEIDPTWSANPPLAPIDQNKFIEPEQLQLFTERRVVTVMFADITGSTPLAHSLDPEEMRAILAAYFNLMARQIHTHGGTVEKFIGDAVMAVFGAPVAHEDDPDRAIRAALDMQMALVAFNQQRLARNAETAQLQMRIGINTGEVAAPGNTSQQRQDFLITGDAVNIAARLQQVAAPDTIVVGERTYLSTRGGFAFRAIDPLHVRGKPEPIAAHIVMGLQQSSPTITQHPRGIGGLQTPLIGRTLELTLLHTNYARVLAERRPHLITILGIPGVGKSRLVRDFIAREQKIALNASAIKGNNTPLVLKGRCPPYGEGRTYWPLVEILRTLLQAQDNETTEVLQQRFIEFIKRTLAQAHRSESAEEIADILLPQIDRGLQYKDLVTQSPKPERQTVPASPTKTKQGGTQGALLRAWRVLLEALGEQQPLLIVVDDIQWADDALLDLLEHLTERVTSVPILFLCPARPDFFEHRRDWGGGQRNFTTIELESLTWEESSNLIDALLNSDDLPETLRYTILIRAEGNPFFVEEIVRMFIDQGVLIQEEQEDGKTRWRIGYRNNDLLGDLSTPGEPPDDALIESHYLLPLPHVPDTIQGVLAARVDLLDPTDKAILQYAAIVGRTFWLSTVLELASNTDASTVLAALDSLIKRDFVIENRKQSIGPEENDRVFSFKHILIRDVVYNNIPRQRRSSKHAQLACWLEEKTANKRETFTELLAYHYQQALATWSVGLSMNSIETASAPTSVDAPTKLTRTELRSRAIHYLTLTGNQALACYYTLRALRAYNDAFEMLLDGHASALTRSKMLEKLGDAYTQRGNLDEASRQYRRALQLATEADSEVDNAHLINLYQSLALLATRWLALFDTPPDAQEIRGYIDAGLQLLQKEPTSRARIAFLTYQALWYSRQISTTTSGSKVALAKQALTSGHEALRLAEELNNPSMLSLALDAMSFIYENYHKYNEAKELQQRRQSLESLLTDREELHDLYISLGRAHEQIADYSTALMWLGRAWSNAQTMENPAMQLKTLVVRMRIWQQWNRWDNACQVAQEVLQFIEKYQQDEKQQFWALETLTTIAYHRGEHDEGDQYAQRCKRLLDQQVGRSNETEKAFISTRMRAIHLAHHDWAHAVEDYKEKLRHSDPFPSPELVATLAELVVRTDESTDIQTEICEQAISLGEQSGARKSLAVALRARGRMYLAQKSWKQAENDLQQSLQRCRALDLPWERAHSLYYLGMIYKDRANDPQTDGLNRRNDLGRARYHFEQALGFYTSLGATPAAEITQQELK